MSLQLLQFLIKRPNMRWAILPSLRSPREREWQEHLISLALQTQTLIVNIIMPFSTFFTGLKAKSEKRSKYDGALENQRYYGNTLFSHHKDPNFVLGFSHWSFPGLDGLTQNDGNVNSMEQIPYVRRHEKQLKSFMCWGLHPWGGRDFLGILLNWYRRTGVCLVSVLMTLPTNATSTRVVSWGSAGSSDSSINQLDIWNQPEAPPLIAPDAFVFQLSADGLFSFGCQVYTTQSARRRVGWCVKK